MISITLFLAVFGFSFCLSHGSASTFWSRRYQASIMVDNWIYFDGGDVAYRAENASGWAYDLDNTTYGIDLSKDWTNSTLSLVQTTRPSDAVAMLSESLWFDDKKNSIYCFGGFKSRATPAFTSLTPPVESIWGFKQNHEGSAAWYQVVGPVTTIPFPSNIHRMARGMSTSDGNRAYYVGGFFDGETSLSSPNMKPEDRIPSPGLLMFDFETLTITNSSDGGYLTPQIPGSIVWPGGAMINIPTYGDDGILVLLPSGRDRHDFAFNNITFYDKKNKNWLSQIAVGDIPHPRSHFCAAGIEGDEGNSFEIFMHGGVINNVLGSQASNSDQVYMLSIPSFRWFRANYTPAQPRGGHTCHIKNGQMIMIGGQDPTYCKDYLGDGDVGQAPADPWLQGIGVFDTKALRFKDSYEAESRAYETPDAIKKYYSTADSRYPSSWTSPALKDLFEAKSNSSSNSTGPTNSTGSTNSTSPITSSPSSSTIPPSRSHHLTHGKIAGLVVGCCAFIVACALGAAFTIRRKETKRKQNDIQPVELANSSLKGFPFEPQFVELPAEQKPREILTEHQDCTELAPSSRRAPMELTSGVLVGHELSA